MNYLACPSCGMQYITIPARIYCACGSLAVPCEPFERETTIGRIALPSPISLPPSPHPIGTLLTEAYPELEMLRGCPDAASVIIDLNATGLSTDPITAAAAIVQNANRTALRQFGPDRATQQAAIAAAIRELIADAANPKVGL